MAYRVEIEGLKELDAALGQLPKSTGRNALRRVLKKRAQPIADDAARRAPDNPNGPEKDLKSSIRVSTKIKNTIGKAEFAAVMRAGGTRQDAGAALRAARKASAGEGSFAEVYVGPERGRNSKVGSLQEFGTAHHAAQPFMRPAWDAGKDAILEGLKDDLWAEVKKAAARVAKRNAKKARG